MNGAKHRLLASLVISWSVLWLQGFDCAFAGSASSENLGREDVPVVLHDLDLVDQEGKRVKFAGEVIGDRVAAIIPFYTTCTASYPVLIYTFTRLQVLLGDRLGKEVVLVSVTVDPRTDTPVRMKAFAQRNKARPGWVFLTGTKEDLGQVLWGAGILFSGNIEEHNHIPITIVGRSGGEWKRYHGFPTPEQLLTRMEELLASKPVR